MQKFFTAALSSSCSIPIRTSILGTKKQQKQNNQFISNQLSQTNIVLSKINFKCELLCSYCLHNFYCDKNAIHPFTHEQVLKIYTFNRRSSISELLFKSLSDRSPNAIQIANQRRQFREELYFAFTKAC